jgi:hypothetical protein
MTSFSPRDSNVEYPPLALPLLMAVSDGIRSKSRPRPSTERLMRNSGHVPSRQRHERAP